MSPSRPVQAGVATLMPMTTGFKTILLIGGAALAGLAAYLHFYAPHHMRALGQALHGGQ